MDPRMREDDGKSPVVKGTRHSREGGNPGRRIGACINPTMDPRKVVLQPEIFGHGLSAREVVAYRRLHGGGTCDLELEQFILQAAALRGRIEREVEEIKAILDDTAVTRDAPVFRKARKTARFGDRYVRRFDHRMEYAILGGDTSEAQALQRLKMRMTRAYSGLWLMVHRD